MTRLSLNLPADKLADCRRRREIGANLRNTKKPSSSLPILTANDLSIQLKNDYPNVFGNPPKPLAIGIHQKVKQLTDASHSTTKIFFSCYTSTKSYLSVLKTGAERVNLDGTVSSEVNAGHAALAQKRLMNLELHDEN